jgi:hypothetical protein
VLDINKSERHIRGGLATREKYLKKGIWWLNQIPCDFGGMPSSLAATRLSYENVKLFTTSSVVLLKYIH